VVVVVAKEGGRAELPLGDAHDDHDDDDDDDDERRVAATNAPLQTKTCATTHSTDFTIETARLGPTQQQEQEDASTA
jgi:hypothetical protein